MIAEDETEGRAGAFDRLPFDGAEIGGCGETDIEIVGALVETDDLLLFISGITFAAFRLRTGFWGVDGEIDCVSPVPGGWLQGDCA